MGPVMHPAIANITHFAKIFQIFHVYECHLLTYKKASKTAVFKQDLLCMWGKVEWEYKNAAGLAKERPT